MIIGIPKETLSGENRVASAPTAVVELLKLGFKVQIQKGCGTKASFTDEEFVDVGATIVTKKNVWQCDIIYKVNPPTIEEIVLMKEQSYLISFIAPAQNETTLTALKDKKITTLAMEMVPRMTRSQSMDALSSMANIAGYRAVIEATHHFGRFLTGQITAAGKMPPAKVMIIGAGVAGLAAIGTASSLGAIVRAFDTRPEVKEQIESMGAEFLELDYEEPEDTGSGDGYAKEMSKAFIDAEMALFAQQAKDVDIAAAGGGNCELTQAGKVVNANGVKIIGYTDLVSRLPNQASQLYANNLVSLTKLLCKEKDGTLNIDFDDVVIRNMTVVKTNEITFPPPPIQVSAAPAKPKTEAVKVLEVKSAEPMSQRKKHSFMAVGALLFAWIASVAPADFLSHFTVFVLACIIGYNVVWNVSHSLHTPLMSVTNAISGIIIVGAILQVGNSSPLIQLLAGVAILIATINIVGGFVVTKRMLKMFRK